MSVTIYIDILFLLNLIINYIIISSTAFISNKKSNVARFLFAAAFGAVYSTIIFFPTLKILSVVVFKIIVSFIIVLISFNWKGLKSQIRLFITYYIINFIYGGGMYSFYRFTSLGSKMNFSNGEYYINLPLWAIIVLAVLFYFLIKIFSIILNGTKQQSFIQEIEITVGKNKTATSALIDTGNELYDPVSQKPIVLIEKNILKKIMDIDMPEVELIRKYNMRIVPFFDASGGSSIIYAFKPTNITYKKDKKTLENTLIGIVQHDLSTDNSYHALMHSKHIVKE